VVYFLPGQRMTTPDEVFGHASAITSSSVLDASSSVSTPQWNEQGRLISKQLPLPIIDDLGALAPALRADLVVRATDPRQKRKMPRKDIESVLLAVCQGHFITLQALAELLHRKPASLRNDYLSRMVKARRLRLAFRPRLHMNDRRIPPIR